MSSSDPSHPEEGTPRASNGTDDRIPLILIHGAWLSARSWERFADFFGARGYAVSAPSGLASTATWRSSASTPTSSRAGDSTRSSIITPRWSTSCVSRPS